MCAEAKRIDLVGYLASLGHLPQKVRNEDYWYLSPLREEKTPSFKANRRLKRLVRSWNREGGQFGGLWNALLQL